MNSPMRPRNSCSIPLYISKPYLELSHDCFYVESSAGPYLGLALGIFLGRFIPTGPYLRLCDFGLDSASSACLGHLRPARAPSHRLCVLLYMADRSIQCPCRL